MWVSGVARRVDGRRKVRVRGGRGWVRSRMKSKKISKFFKDSKFFNFKFPNFSKIQNFSKYSKFFKDSKFFKFQKIQKKSSNFFALYFSTSLIFSNSFQIFSNFFPPICFFQMSVNVIFDLFEFVFWFLIVIWFQFSSVFSNSIPLCVFFFEFSSTMLTFWIFPEQFLLNTNIYRKNLIHTESGAVYLMSALFLGHPSYYHTADLSNCHKRQLVFAFQNLHNDKNIERVS